MKAIDLFAGPGGWDLPASWLGIDVLGVEVDPAPAGTREAAGLRTVLADVAALEPADFGPVDLLIASPPCPDFSVSNRKNARGIEGTRGALVAEVLRWTEALEPRLVACEQVPDVLPVWQAYAVRLVELGYSTLVTVLNAADFGVPQARKRAVLIARRDEGPLRPERTHDDARNESLFPLKTWVTMAEALADLGPYHVRLEEGAPYVETDLPRWALERPSTTVTSGGRVAAPGYRRHDERQFGAGAVRLTPEQAARLQGFPDGYPWRAPRVHQQIGNAVPPPLAEAILSTLTGRNRP